MRKHARKFKYTTARPRPCLSATTCNFRREFPRRKHPIKVSSSRNEIVPFPLFRPRPRESIGNFTCIGGVVIPSNQIYHPLFYIILKIGTPLFPSSYLSLLSSLNNPIPYLRLERKLGKRARIVSKIYEKL